jgi:hypothetical protein
MGVELAAKRPVRNNNDVAINFEDPSQNVDNAGNRTVFTGRWFNPGNNIIGWDDEWQNDRNCFQGILIFTKVLNMCLLLFNTPMAAFVSMNGFAIIQKYLIGTDFRLQANILMAVIQFISTVIICIMETQNIVFILMFNNMSVAGLFLFSLPIYFFIDLLKERENSHDTSTFVMNVASIVLGLYVPETLPLNSIYAILIDFVPKKRTKGLIILSLFTTCFLALTQYNRYIEYEESNFDDTYGESNSFDTSLIVTAFVVTIRGLMRYAGKLFSYLNGQYN